MNREGGREGDEGAAQKETTGKARRRRIEGMVPRTGTSGAELEQATKHRATWMASSGGPQRKEDRRKEPKQEQPRRKEQAGNRAERSGAGGGGQPPGQKHSGDRNPGREHPGQSGAQPQEGIVQGSGPSATAWNIRDGKKPHSNGTGLTGASGGTKWQGDNRKKPGLEHAGKEVQAGNRATRTATSGGQKPSTETSRGEARGPGLERPGLRKGEEAAAARKAGGQSWNTNTRERNRTMKRGEEKRHAVSEMGREGDDGAAPQETNGKARVRRNDVGPVPGTGTSGAGQEQATKHQSRPPRQELVGGRRERKISAGNTREEERTRGHAQGAQTGFPWSRNP